MSTPGSIGRPLRPSSASLTRRSASAFCSRRTWRIDQPSKPAGRLLHLGVQLAHRRVLDLVLALDLAHDQLRVADQLELAGAQRRRPLDAQQQRPVLGDVVGGACRSARRAPRAPRRRRPARRPRSPPGPGLPRAPPSTLTTSFTEARCSAQPARRRRLDAAEVERPPSATPPFHCRAEPSSSASSPPWRARRPAASRRRCRPPTGTSRAPRRP